MDEEKLGLFDGRDKPTPAIAWKYYQRGLSYNNAVDLDDTVRVNENFFVGKQWEGVQANGLPTPQFNVLKRVVGHVIASITTENIKVNATALANTLNTDELSDPVRIINEELDALTEHNNITSLLREFARNAAVDGDGCIYTYWDPDVKVTKNVKGKISSEIISNTRVFFGNPNDRNVQAQPYIQIASREIVRNAKRRAKANDSPDWQNILPDSDESQAMDSVKYTDDKVTVLLTLWKDDEAGEVWAYESTHTCEVKKPYKLGIRLYPICWLNWDYVQDSYHGQAMITGLIPNQIFINKAWAMSMLSIMRTAWPKVIYNKNYVAKWDNRVGGAIPVTGDVNSVAKILDPAAISPQIYQFIELAKSQTEESLGATGAALGEGRADNTSAILALQRAAATPSEMTKQNLYAATEDLFKIYVEFIGEYYGKRMVDVPATEKLAEIGMFIGQDLPSEIPVQFDFKIFKENPLMLKVDVGASTYYSEIASMQTLDSLLMNGHITPLQYLERISDSYIPKRRALIAEMKEAQRAAAEQQAMMMGMTPHPETEGEAPKTSEPIGAGMPNEPELRGGRGYSSIQRALNAGEAV